VRKQEELLSAYETAPAAKRSSIRHAGCFMASDSSSIPGMIEFQVLGDQHGKVIHWANANAVFSAATRNLIEESPSPGILMRSAGRNKKKKGRAQL